MKKIISYLITIMMVFTMIPYTAFAGSAELETETPENFALYIEQPNPLYSDDERTVEVIEKVSLFSGTEETYSEIECSESVEDAGSVLRSGMAGRLDEVVVKIKIQESDINQESMDDLNASIITEALKHTGRPQEGDSLRWAYDMCSTAIEVTHDGTDYYAVMTFMPIYYTTSKQEAELTSAVDALKEELDLDGKSDYEKIKAIYDYMTANIDYDYDNYGDHEYILQFTAYAALVNGTSVCQGYAVLFYRMACEYGIDARLIPGTSMNNKGIKEGHAWNIVKLGDEYYNLDSTWDSTWDSDKTTHDYFLKGSDNFINHTRNAEFDTPEFNETYPMSESDYVPDTDNGEEGENPEIGVTESWADYKAKSFASGEGTAENPYVIEKAEELALLAQYVNDRNAKYNSAYYILENDIDLSGHNWIPIGAILGNDDSKYYGFEGVFDGNNHKISNLSILSDCGDYYHYGLFGMNLGEIRNIVLTDAVIKFESDREGWQSTNGMGSQLEIGGICGSSTNESNVENCTVNNIIIEIASSMSLTCGGAIGDACYVTLNNVSATGSVTGIAARALWVGGAIGSISNYTNVEACSFKGTVYSENDGNIGASEGEIDATGYVHYAGGFCGSAGRAHSNVSIKNCYAVADIYSKSEQGNQDIGGFAGAVGIVYESAVYENLYCKSMITATRGETTREENDFWQGENPFGEQETCDRWEYTNCITLSDSEIVVKNYNEDMKKTDTYDPADTDITELFKELGFSEDTWLFSDTELPALAVHIYSDWIIDKESTCSENGNKHRVCIDCGYEQSVILNKKYHDYSWKYNDMIHWDECECGDTRSESEHTYKEKVVEPTCITEGYTIYKCSVCKYSYKGNITSALGHDTVSYEAKAVGCTENGWKAYETCSRCEYTTYEEIPAAGHSEATEISKATTKKAGAVYIICGDCDKTLKKTVIPRIKTITLSDTEFTYNGSVKKPAVKVKNSKGKKISSKNYTVKIRNSSGKVVTKPAAVGEYKITITFKGNYSGTVTKYYKIIPKGIGVSKITAGKKQLTVKWSKPSSKYRKQIDGYQIRYAVSKSGLKKAKPVTVKGSKVTSKAIKKLKAKKKYYVQIRTYKKIGKKTFYSGWSKEKYKKTR